jgi:hypothetical protein
MMLCAHPFSLRSRRISAIFPRGFFKFLFDIAHIVLEIGIETRVDLVSAMAQIHNVLLPSSYSV